MNHLREVLLVRISRDSFWLKAHFWILKTRQKIFFIVSLPTLKIQFDSIYMAKRNYILSRSQFEANKVFTIWEFFLHFNYTFLWLIKMEFYWN